MAEAVTALEMHFVPKVNVVACRHAFQQRPQRSDESVTQYIAVLRHLAVPCTFGEMEDEMIRDRLIEHAHLCQIRDRLLLYARFSDARQGDHFCYILHCSGRLRAIRLGLNKGSKLPVRGKNGGYCHPLDCHPLPHIEELFTEMRNGTVFSQIDLANAYHPLPLHEDSRYLTAFITHDGLFRYK